MVNLKWILFYTLEIMSKPLTNDKTDIDDNIISFGSDDSITALPSESQSGKSSQFVFL